MQDRYVGDVGDFGKYGLLKALCEPGSTHTPGLRLGVVWYLTPDEDQSNDGKKTQYVTSSEGNTERYRKCDPILYDALGSILRSGQRAVSRVRALGILPPGTVFYETPLSFVGRASTLERVRHRQAWVQGALETTAGCEVVFADPDNGLEGRTSPHHKHGPKYVFFEELLPHVERGQSIIVYHHIGRRGSAKEQVAERRCQINKLLGRDAFALLFHRGSARAFFVVPAEPHWEILLDRAEHLVQGSWGAHFELLGVTG